MAKSHFRHVTHDVGEAYCLAGTHNGAGVTCYGDLFARGSAIVTQNDLVLVARALPAHAFGYFLASRTAGDSLPFGSVGRLCLGGATGRLTNAGVVLSSGPDGSFELVLDLNSIATPTGTVAVQPGETWHFQAWHRDSTESGAPTSNFTDASRVRFL